jgi:hypothetical protein
VVLGVAAAADAPADAAVVALAPAVVPAAEAVVPAVAEGCVCVEVASPAGAAWPFPAPPPHAISVTLHKLSARISNEELNPRPIGHLQEQSPDNRKIYSTLANVLLQRCCGSMSQRRTMSVTYASR